MVYRGILVPRQFLGSQKIFTEIAAILSLIRNNYVWYYKMGFAPCYYQEFLHFSVRMPDTTTRQKLNFHL